IQLELDDLEANLKKGPDDGGISPTLAGAAEPDVRRRLVEAQAKAKAQSTDRAALSLRGSGDATENDIRKRWVELAVAGCWAVVSVRTIRRWVAQGILPAHRVGPKLLKVYPSDLNRIVCPVATAGGDAA